MTYPLGTRGQSSLFCQPRFCVWHTKHKEMENGAKIVQKILHLPYHSWRNSCGILKTEALNGTRTWCELSLSHTGMLSKLFYFGKIIILLWKTRNCIILEFVCYEFKKILMSLLAHKTSNISMLHENNWRTDQQMTSNFTLMKLIWMIFC